MKDRELLAKLAEIDEKEWRRMVRATRRASRLADRAATCPPLTAQQNETLKELIEKFYGAGTEGCEKALKAFQEISERAKASWLDHLEIMKSDLTLKDLGVDRIPSSPTRH